MTAKLKLADFAIEGVVIGEPIRFRFVPISADSPTEVRDPSEYDAFVFGDDQDDTDEGDEYLGHAVTLRRIAEGNVVIRTSLTGFPPIYCFSSGQRVVISPSVAGIRATVGTGLKLDPRGIAEWNHIGHPIGHRTLFADVTLLPAGQTFRVSKGEALQTLDRWSPPLGAPYGSQAEYIEDQAEAFSAAVVRMDVSSSFLSLTAGLDTRVVLAMLVRANRSIPAITLSGVRDSLDTLRARQLCEVLGLKHQTIRPDSTFMDSIERHTLDAVRLSGGLVGIEQSLEAYMYRTFGFDRRSRLSGNLGNQVGRSGTEGTGIRCLSPSWFRREVASDMASLPREHWHRQVALTADPSPLDLIQRESLFASLGNATLGAALATQQTPYADRTLITNKLREPATSQVASGARTRDLMHRFLGEPAKRSFQRSAVVKVGGPVARIPINWGSVPTGGVSLSAVVQGVGAGLDAVLAKESGVLRRLSSMRRVLGIQGLSGFRAEPFWTSPKCREFILDTMRNAATDDHPLFDRRAIDRLLSAPRGSDMRTASQLLTLELMLRQFAR